MRFLAQTGDDDGGTLPKKIAYIVSRFPLVTETFVLREVNAVNKNPHVEVEIFSLFPQVEPTLHSAAQHWLPRLHRGSAFEALQGLLWWTARRPIRLLTSIAWVISSHARRPGVLWRTLITLTIAAGHARTIASLGVGHLHAHWATYPALSAWLCQRLTGIPYSFTVHAQDLFVHQLGLKRKVDDARFIVTISKYNRALLLALGAEDARVHIVHYGVDLSLYRFRRRSPSPEGTVRALCVARLEESKGHRFLFEALARGGPHLSRIELDLVGRGSLEASLRALAKRLGIEDRVHFLGTLPEHEVTALLDRVDLAVLPSIVSRSGDAEGIPNALIEALACGVPVVSTQVTGIPELVRDGKTGLVVDPEDSGALAEALNATLADPLAAALRAEAGRRLVEAEFDIESSATQLVSLFLHGTTEPAPDRQRVPGKTPI